MYITDDPIDDFRRYDAEMQARLDKLPKCSECGEPIQDEYAYLINDEFVCEECLNGYYRVCVENYVE